MIFWQNLEYRNNESRLSSDWPLSLFALPHSRLPLAVYRTRLLLLRLCYRKSKRFNYSQLWSLFSRQSVPVTFFSCIQHGIGVSQFPRDTLASSQRDQILWIVPCHSLQEPLSFGICFPVRKLTLHAWWYTVSAGCRSCANSNLPGAVSADSSFLTCRLVVFYPRTLLHVLG